MTSLRFLTSDPDTEQLLAATAENHLDWMRRLARASGGEVALESGVHSTLVSRRATELTAAIVEPPERGVGEQVDRLLALCRERDADRFGFWAFSEGRSRALGVELGARGFKTGGRPHWMYLDLHALADLPEMAELERITGLVVTDRFAAREGTQLPCFDADTSWVREAMATERPQRVWHAVLWDGDEPYGQISIDATTGDRGVCGLHDTVVDPSRRVTGIGIARLQWVCRFAVSLGCRYLVTNAAEGNAPLFGIWGFRSLGYGQTWWIANEGLRHPVPADLVRWALSIGCGDLEALEAGRRAGGLDVNGHLANGMTPLQFAGAARCAASARWLLENGALPDVLATWDIDGAAGVTELLSAQPELLDGRRQRSGKTLLHLAVERNDAELARLLVRAGIDRSATDHRFGRTALEWARHLRRTEVALAIARADREVPASGVGQEAVGVTPSAPVGK